MKNSDESIEKVLAGLQDAKAPAGMERRILDAVHNHESLRSAAHWWQRSPLTLARPTVSKLLLYGAAFAAIVVVLVSPKIHRMEHVPQPSIAVAPARPSSVTLPQMVADRPDVNPPAKPVLIGAAHMQRAKTARSEDSLAMREMMAPSQPAPPMPLTKQEKLLLRLVHKGDPVELAMLNPELRARQIAEGRAEFQRFFEQKTSEAAQ